MSSLFWNSTLETVFRPFPIFRANRTNHEKFLRIYSRSSGDPFPANSLNPLSFGPFPGDNSANGLRIESRMARLTPICANNGRTNKNRDFLANLFARIKINSRPQIAGQLSGKCKVLLFFRVWSFYSHALYILSIDNSGRFLQNFREVGQIVGDRMNRACE